VYLIEGVLSLFVAALIWFTLPVQPRDASWLTGCPGR
jgi:hypothetical protein